VNDVWQTRAALLGYSVGLPGLILVKILAPGFYARLDMRTPVRYAFITVLVTQGLGVLFAWPAGLGHAGLTLAISIGATLNAFLLFRQLRKRKHFIPQPGWLMFASKLVIALGVLAAVILWLSPAASAWLGMSLWQRVGHLALVVFAGAGAYFASLFLLGFRLADFDRREEGPRLPSLPEEE